MGDSHLLLCSYNRCLSPIIVPYYIQPFGVLRAVSTVEPLPLPVRAFSHCIKNGVKPKCDKKRMTTAWAEALASE